MKNSSFRIRTTPGVDKNINITLEQDYDFLEILSLKISQQDLYQSFCADYGVLVGRVIANEGFGVPNAKVSVFIPISNEDEKNELISSLYPYKTVNSLNEDGVRYNLLLEESTCSLTIPVGTFPSKSRLLEHDIWVEIYEKYYKYTTTTNDAGDYIIFGIPTGQQTIHMDVDLSDIGFLSLRPYDLKAQGYPETLFNGLEFKVSTNLDELPQIRTQNKSVDIQPFWGDKDICTIGISRVDFNIGNDLGANAIFMGSIFTDSDDNALKPNCDVKKRMGEQGQLITGPGRVDIIKANFDDKAQLSSLEFLPQQEIDEDGVFVFTLPMYYDKVITDEFGEIIKSPDPTKGIGTKGKYRFKLKFNDAATIDGRKTITTASLIVPSLHERYTKNQKTNYGRFTINNDYLNELKAKSIPLDYEFHTFEWKQVYTTSQYIKKNNKNSLRFDFIGLKDCGQYKLQNNSGSDDDPSGVTIGNTTYFDFNKKDSEDDSSSTARLNIPYTHAIQNFLAGSKKTKKLKLCFYNNWLSGGNYMFKFRVKNKTKGKIKYCGPHTGFDDGDGKPCACDGNGTKLNQDKTLNDCVVISPNFGKDGTGTFYKSDSNGASDTGEFIYCNFGLSTKIINVGPMKMCENILEDLKKTTANLSSPIKSWKVLTNSSIGPGTGNIEGIITEDIGPILRPTTYEDVGEYWPGEAGGIVESNWGKKRAGVFQNSPWLGSSGCGDNEFKQSQGGDLLFYYCRLDYDRGPNDSNKYGLNPDISKYYSHPNKSGGDGTSNYFYFGLNPGRTALDKLRKNYF